VNFLDKIQNLPLKKRKIIFWSIMIILVVFSFWIYLKDIQKRWKILKGAEIKKEFKILELKEIFKNLPKFEIPK